MSAVDVAIPVRSLRAWSRPVPRAAFAAFSFVTAAFLHLPGLIRQLFDPDEAAIATMGMVISRGGVLYRDVADRKPPLAPVLYAALFQISGTRDLRPVHALVAIELGAAALLVASAVRRRAGDRAAWWAAGLLITGAMVFMSRDTQAANFSHLALLPACGAIVVARRGTTKSAALAGVLLGVAVLTRQTWIIGLAPAAFSAWLHGGRRADHVALVIAATATTILVVAFLFPFGLFWHWTFTANGSLLTGITQSQDLLVRAGAATGIFIAGHLALVWLVARRGWHRNAADLWLWLAAGLVSVVAGFRFFGHYWLSVLPPLCLLGAPALAACGRSARRALAIAVLVPTAVGFGLGWSAEEARRADPTRLVAAARTMTTPGDRITVWGSFPELYWRSGRTPGGALVISDFVVGRSAGRPAGAAARAADITPGALDQYMRSLRAAPPRLFFDTSTAGIRGYQKFPPSLVPRVARFLARHYRRAAVIEGVTIYELKRSVPPNATLVRTS